MLWFLYKAHIEKGRRTVSSRIHKNHRGFIQSYIQKVFIELQLYARRTELSKTDVVPQDKELRSHLQGFLNHYSILKSEESCLR